MATLSSEKRDVFHSLYIRQIEDGQARLVNVLDLLPSAIPMLFDDPPSASKTASQYGIAAYILAQAFLTAQSYVPFNRCGSAQHTLIQELAMVRYLSNSLFQGLTCQGSPLVTDQVSFDYPAGSNQKQDLATVLGALETGTQRRTYRYLTTEQKIVFKPQILRTSIKTIPTDFGRRPSIFITDRSFQEARQNIPTADF